MAMSRRCGLGYGSRLLPKPPINSWTSSAKVHIRLILDNIRGVVLDCGYVKNALGYGSTGQN